MVNLKFLFYISFGLVLMFCHKQVLLQRSGTSCPLSHTGQVPVFRAELHYAVYSSRRLFRGHFPQVLWITSDIGVSSRVWVDIEFSEEMVPLILPYRRYQLYSGRLEIALLSQSLAGAQVSSCRVEESPRHRCHPRGQYSGCRMVHLCSPTNPGFYLLRSKQRSFLVWLGKKDTTLVSRAGN